MPGYTLDDGITLKNRIGATNYNELEVAESDLVANRLVQLELGLGPKGQFDAAHLKAIHHHLFQDVYEWAGHTRDEKVSLSDGTVATEPVLRKVDGRPFLAGPIIPDALEHVAAALRQSNYLGGLPRQEFAEQAAEIMLEINGVHAFREGNGRTQRAFMRELAKKSGYELDFSVVTRERMIQASIAGNENGDNTMMRRMFSEIGNPVRVAALDKAIEALSQHNFPWNDNYIATAEPGHQVEVTLAGTAGEQFMARTRNAILIGQTADLPTPRPLRDDTFTFTPTTWQPIREIPVAEITNEQSRDRER